jgi:hypothetical protein
MEHCAGRACSALHIGKMCGSQSDACCLQAEECAMSLSGMAQTTILAASWGRRPVLLVDKDRRG